MTSGFTECIQPAKRPSRSTAAFTIIETVFAAAIVVVFMAGVCLINSNVLSLMKAQREQSAASLCIQERVEQIRSLTFAQLINSTYIRDSALNTATQQATSLGNLSESVTVLTYPTNTANFTVTRSGGSATTTATSGTIASSQPLVKVNLSLQWTSRNGSTQTRQVSTVVANGGLNSA